MTFDEIQAAQVLPPADAIVIPVEAFSLKYRDRPEEPIPVGIRPLSEDDNNWARREAAKQAVAAHGKHPHEVWVEAYNAALMRLRLVMGLCHPEDARRDWPWWKGVGQELVVHMFSEAGIAWLYSELERVETMVSPASAQISDDDISELTLLAPEALERMPEGKRARIRRLFAFVLEECRAAV